MEAEMVTEEFLTPSTEASQSTQEFTERIIELFYSREDVFPFQWFSPERQAGGYAKACVHRPPWTVNKCTQRTGDVSCGKCGNFKAIPVSRRVVEMHLRDMVTVGSYQLATDGQSVKWLCLDFDDHGEVAESTLKKGVLAAQESFGLIHIPTVIEASGGQGWRAHLWAFFLGPVPAVKVRTVIDYALKQVGLHDRPFIERFPKQNTALNGYGNLVKVPFGVNKKTGKRSCFLNDKLDPVTNVEEALGMIQEVDPLAIDMIIDQHGLTLAQDAFATASAPVRNFDHPVDVMNRILGQCAYFRDLERQQLAKDEMVHYEDWWNYVLMFSRFGDAGVDRIMRFSAVDERFDAFYTMNQVNYIRQHGYHAPSCRRLREGPGQLHCDRDPLDCGVM